jgi:hypothetical protein
MLYMETNIYFSPYLAHFFLEREMFQKNIVEKIKTHFVFSNFFFAKRAVCEKIWGKKNIVERSRPQMTIWRMRIACQITKITNTHTQVV